MYGLLGRKQWITIEEILERMNKGVRFEAACRAAGINPATGWRWRQKSKDFDKAVIWMRFKKQAYKVIANTERFLAKYPIESIKNLQNYLLIGWE